MHGSWWKTNQKVAGIYKRVQFGEDLVLVDFKGAIDYSQTLTVAFHLPSWDNVTSTS